MVVITMVTVSVYKIYSMEFSMILSRKSKYCSILSHVLPTARELFS